jgi:uncharacterized protein
MLVFQARRAGLVLCLAVAILFCGVAPRAMAAPAMSPFLDNVLSSVDTYWHQEDAALGRPAPSVNHVWVAPGAHVATGCQTTADENSAFYCGTDDTIYIGQTFASQLYDGVDGNLPGKAAGFGRAVGAYATAYVVAHEYGHNVQMELGELGRSIFAMPTELNADCLAGTWTAWEYGQRKISSDDVQQVIDAAEAVGDFDFVSPNHHGTPQQRRDAVMTGIKSGQPSACDTYLNSY